MATPFIGEVKIISWNFPPRGWAFCNGQLLPINQNQALFSLFGTFYGGDGRVNFGLPDLRGRIPIHKSNSMMIGQRAGETAVTLNTAQLPSHTHAGQGIPTGPNSPSPVGHLWCLQTTNAYNSSTGGANSAMAASGIGPTGGSQPHDNMTPYLVLNMIVSLTGIYPTQN